MKKHVLNLLKNTFALTAALLLSLQAYAVTHTITINNNSYSPSILSINEGDGVVFRLGVGGNSNHPTVAENGVTDWSTFTLDIPGDESLTFILAVGTHPYFCDIHGSSGGAGMSGTITVNAVTGTKGAMKASRFGLTIAPNPFDNEVTLNIDQNQSELSEIRITDILGNEVAFVDLKNSTSSAFKLDFSHLNPGIYFCNLYSEKGILETRKLLRTR